MNKYIVIVLIFLAGVGGDLLLIRPWADIGGDNSADVSFAEDAAKTISATQTVDLNSVAVQVTPVDLNAAERLVFDVDFETHTVELNFDPKDISYIRGETEQETPALAWNGPGPGGHHRSGQLVFSAISGKEIVVIIKNVAGAPERIFKFKR